MTTKRPLLSLLFLAAACEGGGSPPTTAEDQADLTVHQDYALAGTATQSSLAFGGVPSRAIDNNTDGNFFHNSVTHTNWETNPWWQVDLGAAPQGQIGSRLITSIELWNRTDCCGDRNTGMWVFVSDNPFASTSPSATGAQAGVSTYTISSQLGLPSALTINRTARYVRVQLMGTNYLSLAEVRVWGTSTTVPGPNAMAVTTSWVPMGVVTDETALSAVDLGNRVWAFSRDANGLLHATDFDTTSYAINGSPQLTTDGPGVAYDPASSKVFALVRTGLYGMRFGEATVTGGYPGSFTWTDWSPLATSLLNNVVNGHPTIAIACGQVWVAGRMLGQPLLASRPVGGGTWTLGGGGQIPSLGMPALATNARGDLGVVVAGSDAKLHYAIYNCASHSWSLTYALNPSQTFGGPPVQTITDGHVAMTAIGNRFAVAARGTSGVPIFMMQSEGTASAPAWPNDFEVVQDPAFSPSPLDTITEGPQLYTFRGLIILAARSGGSNATAYAIRDPNRNRAYVYGTTASQWMIGNVVSYWGTAATLPVLVPTGRRNVYASAGTYFTTQVSVPDELYIFARGINDRQYYGLNFGRFMTLDVMQRMANLQFESDSPLLAVPNLVDQLLSFLHTPRKYWWAQGYNTSCSPPLNWTIDLSHQYGEVTFEGCNPPSRPAVRLDDASGGPLYMWQEWGHVIASGIGGFKTQAYYNTFGTPRPRTCNSNADCTGATQAGFCGTVPPMSNAEALLGVGAKVCFTGSSMQRMQGFVDDYDLNPAPSAYDEHAFLDVATYYRWMGDTLRGWVAQDVAQGSTVLQNKYNWLQANFYNYVEYNGIQGGFSAAPMSDESNGAFGMPVN
jgi:hypothetical protein